MTKKNEQNEFSDDEISFIDLFSVLWAKKILIIVITCSGIALAVAVSIISLFQPPEKSMLPNKYTPKALMLINDTSSKGSLSSLLSSSSGLSSIASLAGITSGSSSYSDLAVYLATTNNFLDSVVDKFDLVNRFKIKKSPRASSRAILKTMLKAEVDKSSGVFSISFTDIDPVFAQSVVNYSVQYMEKRFAEMGLDKNKLSKENLEVNLKNTYDDILKLEKDSQSLMSTVSSGRPLPGGTSVMLEAKRFELELNAKQEVYKQLKTQYELIKIQMASETPVFQVLEYAEVPDQKSGPSRAKLCLIVALTSFFGAVFLVFLLNAVDSIKKDPEAMTKLKGLTK
jgi:Chain length determinant protein